MRHERDDMKSPRPFLHWAYFKTKTARRVFVAKIKKLGYAIVGETKPGSFGDALPHGVEFEAVSSMNPDVLAKSNAALSLLATRLGGEYDGWEVEVMRES